MSNRFIVTFKKTASSAVIRRQAEEVNQNGGSVKMIDPDIIKTFTADIPEAYLFQLQSSLKQGGSEIEFIEPDSVVRTQ